MSDPKIHVKLLFDAMDSVNITDTRKKIFALLWNARRQRR